MGNWVSRFAPQKNPDEILNYILKGIFSNIDLLDMYAMSDPKKCSEYVIFGEKALSQFFVKLNLHPEKGPNGELYFRKSSTLRSAFEGGEKHRENCRDLSKFFTLIVEISAALILTMRSANASLTTIAGMNTTGRVPPPSNPTGEIFREPADRKSSVLQNWLGIGGAIPKVGEIALNVVPQASKNRMIGLIVTKYCSSDSQDNSRILMKRDGLIDTPISILTESIECNLNNTNVSLRSLFDKHDASGNATILYSESKYLTFEYVFGKDSEFGFRCIMRIRGDDCDFPNFAWIDGKQPPQLRRSLDGIKTGFKIGLTQAGDNVFGVNKDGRSDYFYNILYLKFKEIENAVYLSPYTTTSTYLANWKYISKEPNSYNQVVPLQNIYPPDLYFDETSRGNSEVKIIYKKTNVQTPNKKYDVVYLECMVAIREIENLRYSVQVTRVVPRRGPRLEGIFLGLQDIKTSSEFESINEMTPPNRNGTSILDFIRNIANKTLNPSVAAAQQPYKKTKTGEFYRVPVIDPANPYDLGKLQASLLPGKSPFPACSALAAELVRTLQGHSVSSVCNIRFRPRQNGSLPKTDRDLMSSRSLQALSALFIDTVNMDAPKLSESAEWKTFQDGMAAATDMDRRKKCKTEGDMIIEDKGVVSQVQEVVDNLLQQQVDHNAAAFDILWELFDRDAADNKEGFKLNTRLYAGGMRRLNEIREQAISLLTSYNIGCQTTHLKGLTLILDSNGLNAKPTGPPPPQNENANENENERANEEENSP